MCDSEGTHCILDEAIILGNLLLHCLIYYAIDVLCTAMVFLGVIHQLGLMPPLEPVEQL